MTAVQQNTQAAVVTDGPTIVYQLPILAEKLDGPLLVVGYGSPMKATVKACVKSGCSQIWVTGTDDKARARLLVQVLRKWHLLDLSSMRVCSLMNTPLWMRFAKVAHR